MNVIAAQKSPAKNVLEGLALTGLLQAVPIYASSTMMLRLFHSDLVRSPAQVMTFVMIAIVLYTLMTPLLGPRFPRIFKHAYEPVFFDPVLPFAEKIAAWRSQPRVQVQLISTMMMFSVLAIAVICVG